MHANEIPAAVAHRATGGAVLQSELEESYVAALGAELESSPARLRRAFRQQAG